MMIQINTKNERNLYIDILRIIAILMVIGTHIKLNWLDDFNSSSIRLMITCIVADGVSIFWMIMGMYFFRNISYKNRIKKLFIKIILPLILMSIFTFYFYDFICNFKSINDSISHTKEQYIDIFKNGILLWQNAVSGAEHLWYLYIYIIIVLLAPLLNKIKNKIVKFNYKKIILVFMAILILNDLTFNNLFQFSHYRIHAVLPALIFLYTGYLLINNPPSNKSINKYKILFFIFIFIINNIIRTLLIFNNYPTNSNSDQLFYWYTSFAFISCISLYYFSYFLFSNIKENKKYSNISQIIFGIYLIHCIIINFFNKIKLNEKILTYVNDNAIFYQIIYTIIIFIISFIIIKIIILIKDFLINKKSTK